ncbi:MAG TPA: hypothetical protein ENH32_06765 [Proteobacteria bacterium]|nr:hypothetical protein [Pseudomonadota bacterium]
MRTHFYLLMLIGLALLSSSCSSPFETGVLVAMPVNGEPTASDWSRAVPLDFTAWMGNVHEPSEIVALDSETSHRSTAQCHHGPSSSEPVRVRLQALYSPSEIFILAQWGDPTRDEDLGSWELGDAGWAVNPGADDGIAFLWGQPGDSEFRCQNTCHMVDVDVYDGGTRIRMEMKNPGKGILDLWRWRAGVTAPFGAVDDMVIDHDGKRGDGGQVIPVLNAAEGEAGPAKGVDWSSGVPTAPYFLLTAPTGKEADVGAVSDWNNGKWHVLFRRSLATGDSGDRVFTPGVRIPFSLSIFDNTWREHHVAREALALELKKGFRIAGVSGRDIYEPLDF